ncbi:glutaredoxin 3 [Fastidiosibacter lacustris]|uniref:glutaredoxin 3 n=1 Tax=Fastidiosibacter lacustris TaxID=2056695 RepID=UPI000E34DBC5|nr:glutaredoxin 3 [Fastidiosibacter lacustris]
MIEIYTKPTCPYCIDAKALLTQKRVDFIEYDINARPELRHKMIDRASGRTTVPQIFINNQHIGGCDDLYALERQHKLDALLSNIN